jgi:hypothetical protein
MRFQTADFCVVSNGQSSQRLFDHLPDMFVIVHLNNGFRVVHDVQSNRSEVLRQEVLLFLSERVIALSIEENDADLSICTTTDSLNLLNVSILSHPRIVPKRDSFR